MQKPTLSELLSRLFRSQGRMTEAMISDLKMLDKRIRRLEGYIEVIEERRTKELKRKQEENATL